MAQGYFLVTPDLQKAYRQAFALKLDDARETLERSQANDPHNLLNIYVGDYLDFFKVFIHESTEAYDSLRERRDIRLEKLKGGDDESPYYLFTQAEVHLHWALIRFKMHERWGAALEINRAFKLLKRNERRFPDFAPNLKSLGMLRAGVGTIPDKYLWAVKLLSSLSGTIGEGMADLERSLEMWDDNDMFDPREAHYFYAMGLLHFANESERAWFHLSGQDWLDPKNNLSDCFVLGHIAMRTGRNNEAIDLYENRARTPDYEPFSYLDFMLGLAKLYRNDNDADKYLKRFVNEFAGINYLKEAYQKLAWHALINGDRVGYQTAMARCRSVGADEMDEDQHALKEAVSGVSPHPQLLRARLLFDGGYYDRSLAVLQQIQKESLDRDHRFELTYRLGRVYHALGRRKGALLYYEDTIRLGRDSEKYYACNAALQAGILHEETGNHQRAQEMYKICLDLKPSDYQASLHQKAKAGQNRLKSAR